MKMRKKHIPEFIAKAVVFISVIWAVITLSDVKSVNAKALDEILSYEITADICDDATVNLVYNIKWKVLDSKSEGPLEWVQIGIPNSHCVRIAALSNNISSINTNNSGGNYAVIYFDRSYKQNEVVDFSFVINQDYMYQVYPEEEVAEYSFTPGWFDSIEVDNLKIKWKSDNAIKIEPASFIEDGYYCFETSLRPSEKYSIEIQYPLDAYTFDLTEHKNVTEKEKDRDLYEFSEHSALENLLFSIFIIMMIVIIAAGCSLPIVVPILIVYTIYKSLRGFSVTKDKKITRTIVEYYDSCQNCGGTREEGKEVCSYCGSNMVKSKQEIKEEEARKTNRKILDYKTNGEYRYSSNPNQFVRIKVVTVPHITRTNVNAKSNSTRSSGVGRHYSSCAHSSCAHSSCACACACACAGGGRAGCTTKDFYNTDMKLRYLHGKRLREKRIMRKIR